MVYYFPSRFIDFSKILTGLLIQIRYSSRNVPFSISKNNNWKGKHFKDTMVHESNVVSNSYAHAACALHEPVYDQPLEVENCIDHNGSSRYQREDSQCSIEARG
jgi:hypothetical protein